MRKLAFILVAAGIIIASVPSLGHMYVSFSQRALMSKWEAEMQTKGDGSADLNAQEYEELQHVFEEELSLSTPSSLLLDEQSRTNEDSPFPASVDENTAGQDQPGKSTQQERTAVKPSSKPVKPKTMQIMLGRLKIDKIKLDIPVVEGTGKENLKVGAGHIPGTSGIGEIGNCAIAGHRNYTFQVFFDHLDQLETGDEIVIATKEKTYIYKVYEKLIVEPDDISVLETSEDGRRLTLITCHPRYVASHRLVIFAKAEET